MRTIERPIAGALIWSSDGKLLLGRRPQGAAASYAGRWLAPGGGIEAGETHEVALHREVFEECGISLNGAALELVDSDGQGEVEWILPSGERVIAAMRFYMYTVKLGVPAAEVQLTMSAEFEELRWFDANELKTLHLVPAGRELFLRLGLL